MSFVAKTFGFKGRINSGGVQPDKPIITTAVAGSLKILVSWSLTAGATSYYVMRDGVTIPASVGTTGLFFLDTVPAPGPYTYIVVAVSDSLEEAESDPSTITAIEFSSPALMRFEDGDLIVDIEWGTTDTPILTFKDGVNDIRQELPFNADQISGLDWAIIKLVRSGTNLIITCDKTAVATITGLTAISYGGNVHIGENTMVGLFDVRIIPSVVTKDASDYYIDDINENGGDAMMPRR